ncbi:MAG: M48 family metalloprotease [Burkholderiaceae bacterium]|nr:M48 family metalloprotease [Burkholderiaceae bacterium]
MTAVRRWTWIAGIAACLLTAPALAQHAEAPESGRWQEMRYGFDEVSDTLELRYIEQVVALAAAGRLDTDRVLLRRVQAIGNGLVAAAAGLKPEVAHWQWEWHVAEAPGVEAHCEAGGKILVGGPFIRALRLDDGELAMLLAHEVAHVVAEHHRETLSEAMLMSKPAVPVEVALERLDSDVPLQVRLAGLSHTQEREADQLGMVIAHRAGWPARAMTAFYGKLTAQAASEGGAPLIATHPSYAARLSTARGLARLLEP